MAEIHRFPLRGRYLEEAERQDRIRQRFSLVPLPSYFHPLPSGLIQTTLAPEWLEDAVFAQRCEREMAGDLDE